MQISNYNLPLLCKTSCDKRERNKRYLARDRRIPDTTTFLSSLSSINGGSDILKCENAKTERMREWRQEFKGKKTKK
ncbi:MAG: hypothetical protein ACI90V_006926 [Bacillariaceae sp.]|jgi:hypothetical protein